MRRRPPGRLCLFVITTVNLAVYYAVLGVGLLLTRAPKDKTTDR